MKLPNAYILPIVLLGLLLMFVGQVRGQTTPQDPKLNQKVPQSNAPIDSLRKNRKMFDWRFTFDGVRFGADVFYWALYPLDANKLRTEFTVDAGFFENRIVTVADFGYSDISRIVNLPLNGYQYNNVGYYWRVGADYNLFQRYFDDEAFFVGLRFANANFKHDLTYIATSQEWDLIRERNPDGTVKRDDRYFGRISQNNLSATWGEIVTGLRVNVWRNFFLGYTVRLMIRTEVKGENELIANDLPGFGTTNRQARLGFNYYIYYRFGNKWKEKMLKKALDKIRID